MFANLDVRTIYLVLAVLSITQALLMFYVRQVHYNSPYVAEWARGNMLIAAGLCLTLFSDLTSSGVIFSLMFMLLIWGNMHIAFGVALVAGRRPMLRSGTVACGAFMLAYLTAYFVGIEGFGRMVMFALASSVFLGYSIYCCFAAARDELRSSLRLVAVMNAAYLCSLYIHLAGVYFSGTIDPGKYSAWYSGLLITNIVLNYAQTIMLIIITSHRLQMELQQQATHDPLTNVFNRRGLTTLAERDIARSNRRGTLISVLMIDADHFKNINDSFGHGVGDIVLKVMATKIQSCLRIEDVLARLGGEEFLVMLPDTSLPNACEVADRIRLSIAQLSLPELSDGRRFTVSIGVAERQGVQQNFDELVDRADQALYQAKKNGRNQVFAHQLIKEPIKEAIKEPLREPGLEPATRKHVAIA